MSAGHYQPKSTQVQFSQGIWPAAGIGQWLCRIFCAGVSNCRIHPTRGSILRKERLTALLKNSVGRLCYAIPALAILRLRRQPKYPNAPRPLAKSGNAPGSGVGVVSPPSEDCRNPEDDVVKICINLGFRPRRQRKHKQQYRRLMAIPICKVRTNRAAVDRIVTHYPVGPE